MTTQEIQNLVTGKANQYGIPVGIALAQVQAESGFNPNAVSPVGAKGLMQLMPGTANNLGVSDIFDPSQNVDAGMRYLKQQYDKFGDWGLALAAYNAGPGNVVKYGNSIPPFQETQNYVEKIISQAGLVAANGDIGNDSSGVSDIGVWVAIGLGGLIGLKVFFG